jgi:hypothetical protein
MAKMSPKAAKIMQQLKNPGHAGASGSIPADTSGKPPSTNMASGFVPPHDSGKPFVDPAKEAAKHAPKGK